jgi:hypothetical protein
MKKNLLNSIEGFLLILIVNVFSIETKAQSTYQQVYNIFQAKCSGCHNTSSYSGQLNLSAAPATVYANIVGHNPVNPAALARGDKRIDKGYPHRSFLMRKVNIGLDADNDINQPQEGAVMPNSPNPPLSSYEKELIRQWILHGAPQTGIVVDTALINTYYTVGGINSVPTPLNPPSSNGFQVHLGKVFVAPNSETEVFIKYDPKLADTTEVNRIDIAQSPQSHHFVIYKFYTGQAVNFVEGLRDTSQTSHGSADILAAFAPSTTTHILPATTAYQLQKTAVMDLNYHIVNSDPTQVLAAEVYFNMYTQPKGTAQKFMYSRFFPDLNIVLPPHDTTVVTQTATDSSETNMWEIWIMYTHTHKYGIDYDVYKRNPNGTMGPQVYEGFMDWTYTFNQGYYATGVEATEEHFTSPFLEINPYEGLIHQAKWYVSGPDTMFFGLTSQQEMMVMGFQYTYGPPIQSSSIQKFNNASSDVKFYPNPFSQNTTISIDNKEIIDVKELNLQIFDMLGNLVYIQRLNSKREKLYLTLNDGMYFYRVNDEKNTFLSTGKIMVAK